MGIVFLDPVDLLRREVSSAVVRMAHRSDCDAFGLHAMSFQRGHDYGRECSPDAANADDGVRSAQLSEASRGVGEIHWMQGVIGKPLWRGNEEPLRKVRCLE